MSDRLQRLREQRGQTVKEMREILDRADQAKRDLTNEETAKYDEMAQHQQRLADDIAREERQVELDREAAATAGREQRGQREPGANGGQVSEGEQRMGALRTFLAGGLRSLSDVEARALSASTAAEGGNIVPPEEFVAQLIKDMDNQVFIRRRATSFQLTESDTLGVPTLAGDVDDADWTSEIATVTADTGLSFGKRSMTPTLLSKEVLVSRRLLRVGALSPDVMVRQRLAYKFGITQEKAFLLGSGTNQPLGVFTASADGVPASRDVATGNTATAITFDGLKSAKFALKGQYWRNASWLFHRDVLADVSKLKDNDGQYLWQPSTQAGEPDRLLNLPVDMSEYAPNTMTTGQYVGIVGDFSHYWIADGLDMEIQRLDELYARSHQVGFIGRMEADGAPVLPEAFARVTLA